MISWTPLLPSCSVLHKKQQVAPNSWYLSTKLHDVITYKTTVAILITSELQSEVHTLQFNFRTCYSTISAELLSQRNLFNKETALWIQRFLNPHLSLSALRFLPHRLTTLTASGCFYRFILLQYPPPTISGSLSPRNGLSSRCGWRNGLHYGG